MIVPRRILHVDDDPQITSLVGTYLRGFGFETLPVHDPSQAIRQLSTTRERIVLLDIDMPQLDGLTLLKQIKAFDGGIQVVMLSGLVTMTTVLQSLHWGAEACYFKPISDIRPLADGLDACFQKIERWWNTLEDLNVRRKSEANSSAALAEGLFV
jgi:DNA-binding response OmpR family regulator